MQDTPEEIQGSSQNTLQDRSSQTDAQDLPESGSRQAEDSPELLRWRADILLDEMMLGAVDVAAGRPGAGIPPVEQGKPASSGDETLSTPSRGDKNNAVDNYAPSRRPLDPWLSSRSAPAEELPKAAFSASEDLHDDAVGGLSGSHHRTASSGAAAPPFDQGEPFLRPPSASAALAAQGAAPPDPRYGAPSAAASWREKSTVSPFDAQERRSNLLPRSSQFDVTSHLREIERLELEIERSLPAEHEWRVRSQHLLAKAAAILKSSPERSAEVDYYLQQVRAIVDRAQQTARWSKVYVKRLTIYLMAWSLFSVVSLAACMLYAEPLTSFFVNWVNGAADDFIAQHIAGLLVTLFAGTLGASLGALRNMARYRRLGRGYVDRKYSLRTLLLPLLALVFALLVYLLFGLVYSVAGIYPLQEPLLGAIPVLAAFVFGLTQESLYGTAA